MFYVKNINQDFIWKKKSFNVEIFYDHEEGDPYSIWTKLCLLQIKYKLYILF